jgi:hypothetical protein
VEEAFSSALVSASLGASEARLDKERATKSTAPSAYYLLPCIAVNARFPREYNLEMQHVDHRSNRSYHDVDPAVKFNYFGHFISRLSIVFVMSGINLLDNIENI